MAPASHEWVDIASPQLDKHDKPLSDCIHTPAGDGRVVHVVTRVDTRLLFEDLFAKLAMFHTAQEA